MFLLPPSRNAISGLWRYWFRLNGLGPRLQDSSEINLKLRPGYNEDSTHESNPRRTQMNQAISQQQAKFTKPLVQIQKTINCIDPKPQPPLQTQLATSPASLEQAGVVKNHSLDSLRCKIASQHVTMGLQNQSTKVQVHPLDSFPSSTKK